MTNDQIADGLDAFYKDPKNRHIRISDAIFVVKKRTGGSSVEELNAILSYLRDEKKDKDKLLYRNKEGGSESAMFP